MSVASARTSEMRVRDSIQRALDLQQRTAQSLQTAVDKAKEGLLAPMKLAIPEGTKYVRLNSPIFRNQVFRVVGRSVSIAESTAKLIVAPHDKPNMVLSVNWTEAEPLDVNESTLATLGCKAKSPRKTEEEKRMWGDKSVLCDRLEPVEFIDGEKRRVDRIGELETMIPESKTRLAALSDEYTRLTGIQVNRTF